MWSRMVNRVFEKLVKAIREATHGYRPERHYMRGPGPKSRERHGQV